MPKGADKKQETRNKVRAALFKFRPSLWQGPSLALGVQVIKDLIIE
jgi:hypothetical protein